MKGAIVDLSTGQLVTERFRIPTPQPATPRKVTQVLREVVQHFQWKGAVGIGFPAIIEKGYSLTASNIDKGFINYPVEKEFSKAINLPVKVVNDADAAGLAEIRFGDKSLRKGKVLMLTIGTGIGSAYFLDGKLIPNTEFGHIHYKDKLAEHVFSNAARKKAEKSKEDWAKSFNDYLQYIERILYPDCIILGGGISKHFESYGHHFNINSKIIPASLRNHAGIIGAALSSESLMVEVA